MWTDPKQLVLQGLVNAPRAIVPPPGRTIAPERLHDGAQCVLPRCSRRGTTFFAAWAIFRWNTRREQSGTGACVR